MIFRSGSTASVSRFFCASFRTSSYASLRVTSSTRHKVSARRFAPYAAAFLATTLACASPSKADVSTHGASVTVMPGAVRVAHGMRVAVISATSTAGSADDAQRAMLAANSALKFTRGFVPVSTSEVTAALQGLSNDTLDTRNAPDRRKITNPNTPYGEQDGAGDARIPIDTLDLKALSKRLKNSYAASVFITPGDNTDTRANYSAVVEVYDLKTGGVINRGEGSFTANLDAAAAAAQKNTEVPVIDGVANTSVAKGEQLALRALAGSVFRAVQELNRPIELRGSVLSIPGAYRARISLNEIQGLRQGARIEYLEAGVPIAYGTVTSVAAGEAEVTVAPENAFSGVYVNMLVRNVSNPLMARKSKTVDQINDEVFNKFERDFSIGLAILGVTYLIFRPDSAATTLPPAS